MVLLSSPSSVLKLSKVQCFFFSNSLYRLNSVEDLMANPGLVAETKEVLKTLPDLERLLKKQEKFVYFLSLSQKESSGIWRSYRTQRDVCSNPSLQFFVVFVVDDVVLTRWATQASYNLNRSSVLLTKNHTFSTNKRHQIWMEAESVVCFLTGSIH